MKLDYIIVGQGIAGTLLDWHLQRNDLKGLVFDPTLEKAASHASSGIINPLTGRKFKTARNFDVLYQKAKSTYLAIEKQLDLRLFNKEIIHRYVSEREWNDWTKRRQSGDVEAYIYAENENRISIQAGLLFSSQFIHSYRDLLIREGRLMNKKLIYDHLQIMGETVSYEHFNVRNVIFCEGAGISLNPFFRNLQFKFSAGKALVGSRDNKEESGIYKRKYFTAPWHNQLIWIGSENAYLDTQKEDLKIAYRNLERFAQNTYKNKFNVLHKLRGVRTTSEDRLPIVGKHPKMSSLYILNGMSTKGSLYAPLLAEMLCDLIIQGKPVDPIYDIQRFYT